jgi:hypothetical protein
MAFAVASVLFAASCAGGEQTRTPLPAPQPPPTFVPPPVPAPVTPPSAVPSAGTGEPERFDFHVVVQGGQPADVVVGSGGGLVLARRAVVEVDADGAHARSKPYGGEALAPLGGGYSSGYTIRAAIGSWPDAVFVTDYTMPGACGMGDTPPGLGIARWSAHHFTLGAYRAFHPLVPGEIEAASRWVPDTGIAVATSMPFSMDPNAKQSISLHAFGKSADRPLPKPAAARPNSSTPPLHREDGQFDRLHCGTLLGSASSIGALSTGEVFVLGTQCHDAASAVEWWDADLTEHFAVMPRAAKGIMDLPRVVAGSWPVVAPQVGSIVVRSPRDVRVGGSRTGFAYLADFDGQEWHAVEPPMRAAITSMDGLPGASLWATTADGELWRKREGGAWAQVDLGKVRARRVRVGGPTDVWIVADDAVLRSVAPANVVTLPTLDPQKEPFEWATEPATAGCTSVFAALYNVTAADRVANHELPKTRELLRGHGELAAARFVVTNTNAFGAIVDSLDAAKHVAEVFRAGRAGTTPNLLCETPVVARELRFEWNGGEVVQASDL